MTEILYDKDGNGWEKDAVYSFSNDHIRWRLSRIADIREESRPYLDLTGRDWRYIRECKAPLGKIHKKPVELIDGQWYKFVDNKTGDTSCGVYRKCKNYFLVVSLHSEYRVKPFDACKITRMVEAKDNENS